MACDENTLPSSESCQPVPCVQTQRGTGSVFQAAFSPQHPWGLGMFGSLGKESREGAPRQAGPQEGGFALCWIKPDLLEAF